MQREGIQIITSGSSATINNGVGVVYIDPASVIAAFTLTMPSAPADRDEIVIGFGGTIASAGAVVTALTMAANTGQALVGIGLASALSGNSMTYKYRLDINKWYQLR